MAYHIRVRAGALIIENNSILLIEFLDENGLHYNLPAGGVEPNETVKEAVCREAKEEASIDVEVGELAFAYEYAPQMNAYKYGETHQVGLMFECELKAGSTPKMPETPDQNQTDVKWIPLDELEHIILYPNIKEHIVHFVHNKKTITFIDENL
ncbi:NUDIX hydrolase [Bacillus sp. 7586-K]|uniref:8-oxo-dGTP pyrophosphatase MutT (NUDIX family) n=1 Tax=Metabacillus niabensis TaxID=324854 RepID=A0ABT9Z0Z1_9BACI|nr:NUDIX domain-containing protein [Metabacillus niabensis]MDQ0225909.1 8-oxo-dGTP pyrophosphatase MutT (NUDIX family) [Metabacillus niabensis]PAD68654.1 NUDIX hydrolase [Bacillus sp. 7586-K]